MKQLSNVFMNSLKREWVKDLYIAICASILIGLASPLTMHLPFTPVPVTIQVQLVLLFSALLGPRRALYMVLAFLMQGAMGLPVFAGGASTVAHLIGPRGGYLIGYLVAAIVVGACYQKTTKSSFWLFSSMCLGNIIVYLCGFSWLAQFLGAKKAFLLGVTPFLMADLIKLISMTVLKEQIKRLVRYFYH